MLETSKLVAFTKRLQGRPDALPTENVMLSEVLHGRPSRESPRCCTAVSFAK